MIAIVDYGLGNIRAFLDIYRRLNLDVRVAQDAQGLSGATKLILPGVGAFDWAMEQLNASGMRESLERMVVVDKCPVLGVCVGMQMLARASAEGVMGGLGWVAGTVVRFPETPAGLPVPHMGWNEVNAKAGCALFAGMQNPRFYFLHSYYFVADEEGEVLATSTYGAEFAAAVRAGNVYGTQFHPEKSHHWGVQLLKNFAEL